MLGASPCSVSLRGSALAAAARGACGGGEEGLTAASRPAPALSPLQTRHRAARSVFERAHQSLKEGSPDAKEERVMLLEAWRQFEVEAGSGQQAVAAVEKKLPRRVKKRRQLFAADGTPAGQEEYFDYIFPVRGRAVVFLLCLCCGVLQRWVLGRRSNWRGVSETNHVRLRRTRRGRRRASRSSRRRTRGRRRWRCSSRGCPWEGRRAGRGAMTGGTLGRAGGTTTRRDITGKAAARTRGTDAGVCWPLGCVGAGGTSTDRRGLVVVQVEV